MWTHFQKNGRGHEIVMMLVTLPTVVWFQRLVLIPCFGCVSDLVVRLLSSHIYDVS